MKMYFALWRGARSAPETYGVARQDTTTGDIERYDDGVWLSAHGLADEIMGGEPGAREITKDEADQLIAGGTLDVLLPENRPS